jgi:hypothetical protein
VNDFSANRMLGGTGTLHGPSPGTLLNLVVDLVKQSLPLLAATAVKKDITNEDGLNSLLSLFISKAVRQKELPFIVQHQSTEDLTRGGSAAPDIGIHLDTVDDAEPPPRITVFEGKRLTSNLGPQRRREYVVGHEVKGRHIPCGGIERFKQSIHGRDLTRAGMIGYIQEETPEYWHGQINSWISELSVQTEIPKWSEAEQLTPVTTEGRISESASVVYRLTDELHLTHLWINLFP